MNGFASRPRALASAALVAAALLIAGWWHVQSGEQARLEREIAGRERLVASLRRLPSPPPASAPVQATPFSTVDRTARSFGLEIALNQRDDAGRGAVEARVVDAPFEQLLAWLERLRTGFTIALESARLQQGEQPGTVTGELVLGEARS